MNYTTEYHALQENGDEGTVTVSTRLYEQSMQVHLKSLIITNQWLSHVVDTEKAENRAGLNTDLSLYDMSLMARVLYARSDPKPHSSHESLAG